ncbi:MAG: hypothetical protein WBB30_06585 [Solirubrobacterales bacterium]
MATTTKSKTQTTAKKPAAAKPAPKTNAELVRERAIQTAETAVDVPVGAALTVYERATEVVEPFGTPSKREAEMKRVRTQLRRELNKVERRGGTARRRALQRAKRTRNRLEREVRQQQRGLETTVRRNRRKVETELKKFEKDLTKTRGDAEKRVRELVDRAQGESTEVAA